MDFIDRSVKFETVISVFHEFYNFAHAVEVEGEVVFNLLIGLTVGCVLFEKCQQVGIFLFLFTLFYLDNLDLCLVPALIIRVLDEIGVHIDA